jgi:hypothetical protein
VERREVRPHRQHRHHRHLAVRPWHVLTACGTFSCTKEK